MHTRSMTKLPNMLLIGSTGRNSGKTEFACRIIRHFSQTTPITGLKVTTLSRNDGTCPRGGTGCGVCSSLPGEYCITDEADAPAGKDTARLLSAGASRVYWLRALKSHLLQGLTEVLKLVGPDTMLVCESNRLRTVAQPGVFLMVANDLADSRKDSAAAVAGFADKTVRADAGDFSLQPSAITIRNGRWAIEEDATAIILAGGESGRMGENKAMLPLGDTVLIQHMYDEIKPHFKQVIVSAADTSEYAFLGAKLVPDRTPRMGPLMGIACALMETTSDLNIVMACDMPEISMPLARRLLSAAGGYELVVPRYGDYLEPLFAVYSKAVSDKANDLLAEGEKRVRRLFDRCRTLFLDLTDMHCMTNLNTKEEYLAHVSTKDGIV